jgi:signal peptidase I
VNREPPEEQSPTPSTAPPTETASDPFGDPGGDTLEALERLRADARDRGERTDATRSFWRELPFLIVVALLVAVVIKTFLVQAFFIPSASMRETLLEGDRVMVNKLAYRFGEPERYDVIVFDSPLDEGHDGENFLQAVFRNIGEALGLSTPDSALIKRVIATEGETIEIRDNAVFIDGVQIDESYLTLRIRMADFGPLTVPDNHVFVMGDNRNQSEDSRRFGPIPENTIIGRAFARVWPPSRWGGL